MAAKQTDPDVVVTPPVDAPVVPGPEAVDAAKGRGATVTLRVNQAYPIRGLVAELDQGEGLQPFELGAEFREFPKAVAAEIVKLAHSVGARIEALNPSEDSE